MNRTQSLTLLALLVLAASWCALVELGSRVPPTAELSARCAGHACGCAEDGCAERCCCAPSSTTPAAPSVALASPIDASNAGARARCSVSSGCGGERSVGVPAGAWRSSAPPRVAHVRTPSSARFSVEVAVRTAPGRGRERPQLPPPRRDDPHRA
ncbi:MAG: hypothetical protein K8S98_06970 [Planctomycetes bacterium]|nr:hypothetical protein [Planctomycetota bacterium]